jgi:hypothetical protein
MRSVLVSTADLPKPVLVEELGPQIRARAISEPARPLSDLAARQTHDAGPHVPVLGSRAI